MSKNPHGHNSEHTQATHATQEVEAAPKNLPDAAPVATAAPEVAADERYRKLLLDEAGSTFAWGNTSKQGLTVNRIDFIRAAWQVQRQSRGAITKELTRLTGKKVTYQIVFASTKGVPGGPVGGSAAQGVQPQPTSNSEANA